ncbi:hypothetical protein BP6252_11286 [Coleophoma cylindrospora]|uniref:Uncharacterized protein n=1 Tax=Coleophoma cylindrospora TaxID=1849047 RepID=A0A3D8QPU5_9HELO|nr:hypothetical protein BP6252_11286 [Coleophoma cylindrospora]
MLYGFFTHSAVPDFTPDNDIPSQEGRVIIITGGNAGLGKETLLRLAKHNPERIYIVDRSEESIGQATINEIQSLVPGAADRISYLRCDLADLPSVAACARKFTTQESRLDTLICCAGVMGVPASTTKQGYEMHFGTNHVGHALLTQMLLPTLSQTAEQEGADVRVVTVSSFGHVFAFRGLYWAGLKGDMKNRNTYRRYGYSKLANILYTKELARRYPRVTFVAVHPGVVDTPIYVHSFSGIMAWARKIQRRVMTSVADGAKNQLWAATFPKGGAKGQVLSGEYYTPVGVTGQGTRASNNLAQAAKLWEWTEKELEGYMLKA